MSFASALDNDPVSALATEFSALDSSRPAILFGSFQQVMDEAPEAAAQTVQPTVQSLAKEMADDRRLTAATLAEIGGQLQKLTDAVELANKLPAVKPVGPTTVEAVAAALSDEDTAKESCEKFGDSWLLKILREGLLPASASQNVYLASKLAQQLISQQGMPQDPLPPLPPAGTSLPASSRGSPLPASPFSAPAASFPFASALVGRHIKADLPKPSKFSRIAADSDIRAWLTRMHEYFTITGMEPAAWVVVASNFLDKAPLQLWEARKLQYASTPEEKRGLLLQVSVLLLEHGQRLPLLLGREMDLKTSGSLPTLATVGLPILLPRGSKPGLAS